MIRRWGVFGLLLVSFAARADDLMKWDVGAEGMLGLTLGRLGALLDVKARAKHGLYASKDEVFETNFVSMGLSTQVSPVFANGGVAVDFQPASFVRLSAGYHFVGYYGVWGSLRQPTDCEGIGRVQAGDARCDFHPIGFEDEPNGISTTGHRLWGELTLMGKVGPIIALGGARVERWMMNSPGTYWVNELYGVVSTKADTTITGGGAVLYEVLAPEGRRPELLLGVADDLAWSVGPDSFFNRVGAVGSLRAPKWGGWRDVTVQLCFSLYTHERYLHGTPYVALALSAVTPNFLGQ